VAAVVFGAVGPPNMWNVQEMQVVLEWLERCKWGLTKNITQAYIKMQRRAAAKFTTDLVKAGYSNTKTSGRSYFAKSRGPSSSTKW
jgi:hypothetical protein